MRKFNLFHFFKIPLMCIVAMLVSCSGKGTDLVDSSIDANKELALLSIDSSNNGELARFNESKGFISKSDILTANKDKTLPTIDLIKESFDRLYLFHKAEGTISVASLKDRKIISQITGFPKSADSGIFSMAFSNLSQAWVIAYNTKKLYLVDVVNNLIAREIPLRGYPTYVETLENKVFVSSTENGKNLVEIISSNNPSYSVEFLFETPSPVVFMARTNTTEGLEFPFVMVCSGLNGSNAKVLYMNFINKGLSIASEFELPDINLEFHIGSNRNLSILTDANILFLVSSGQLIQLDLSFGKSSNYSRWLEGNFSVINADKKTGLLYAYNPDSSTLSRISGDGGSINETVVSSAIKAIIFVSSNKIQI